MAYTLVEFQKTVTDPFRKGIIQTVIEYATLLQYMKWRTIPGLAYKYNQNITLPGVNFRKLNEAFTSTQGVTNRLVEALKILGGDSDTDIELVRAYGEAERTSRDTLFTTAMIKQFTDFFFYGNCGARVVGSPYEDADGFDGLVTRLSAAQNVDGTGTSSTVGSSVFAIKFGDPYCLGLQSHDLDARNLGEIDSSPVYRSRIDWTPGFGIFHGKGVARLKNLDTTQKCTAARMNALRDKVYHRSPDLYVMSLRSSQQLWADCIAIGVELHQTIDMLGRPVDAWGGVPIAIDDSIVDTEDNTA